MVVSQLGYYARRVAESVGMEHQIVLRNLRAYIKQTPERELLEAIQVISSPSELRALWEAGLNAALQEAVLKRYDEIVARRE